MPLPSLFRRGAGAACALLSIGTACAVEPTPAAGRVFAPFAPGVTTRSDGTFLYVESRGLPAHPMMVGITSWQQQVPLPQDYRGDNAWRVPLAPVPAVAPLSARSHFFRGAIAIAANGVPIFNPIKNDGRTDTFLAGELDDFGGHCGRADDYHYHIAPLHLQALVGAGQPIAFALDGYPILGLTEPDGAEPVGLDSFNGHTSPALGYHYHASKKYPYVNGGFHGEVVEVDGQVDPQPRAQSIRPALPPWRSARITEFTSENDRRYALTVRVGAETHRVNYELLDGGSVRFTFVDGDGGTRTETYAAHAHTPAPARAGRDGDAAKPGPSRPAPAGRQPWLKVHALEMDADKNGELSLAELVAEIARVVTGYDLDRDGKISAAERAKGNVRSALGGFVKQHAEELDADHDGMIARGELEANTTRMFQKADADRDGRLAGAEIELPAGYVATPPSASAAAPKP